MAGWYLMPHNYHLVLHFWWWCPYWYWHFCTLVQYQYGHIPLPELGSQHGARTSTGIFALRFSTGIGTFHYRYWHSVVPVPVSAFRHFGSVPIWAHTITGTGVLYGLVPVLAFLHLCAVPVEAHSITGTGIQQWYLYWYRHFCTLVQYR